MSVFETIHAHVQNGLVIDEQGKWVPIASMREREAIFLSHIENGEVLHKKKWISIGEALATSKNESALQSSDARDTKRLG